MTTVNVYCCDCHTRGAVVLRIGDAQEQLTPLPSPSVSRKIRRSATVELTFKTEQFRVLTVSGFVDDRGHPAPVDGPPIWTTDNSDLVSLLPAADGMSCKVTTLLMGGEANVQVSADGDTGPAVVRFATVVKCVVTPRNAVAAVITATEAQDTE